MDKLANDSFAYLSPNLIFSNFHFASLMKQILVIFSFFLITANGAYSQNYTPLELAKHIFNEKGFPAIKKYTTGEYEGHPNGKELQKNAVKKFLLLSQTTQKAVVAMSVKSPAGNGVDLYLYFKKDNVWKMNAIRSLAMMGVDNVRKEYP
ncbi:hypothetical protein BH09BAC4_BH09BAC4_40730 [soil metagenome]